ncbi:MAG: ATP-binding protein [Desulfobacterales bacterium]|nr:ATP-binding protein [Desulfobacterales bacterium]
MSDPSERDDGLPAREGGIETASLIRFHIRNTFGIFLVLGCLIAGILVIMALDFSRNETRERAVLESDFRERTVHLDSLLSQITGSLDAMKSLAESDLEATRHLDGPAGRLINDLADEPPMPPLAGYFQQSGAYFHLDRRPGWSDAGNLTGWGVYVQRPARVKREIRAALMLNPLFSSVRKTIKTSAWLYYISAGSFINLYPWVASSEWKFDSQIYLKELYQFSLPGKNPGKGIYWTPVYVDGAGKGLMTTCGVPVYDRDDHMGAVAIDLTVDFLNTIVSAFRPGRGTLFLVNDQGQILAHPEIASSSDAVKSFFMAVPGNLNLTLDDLKQATPFKILETQGVTLVYARLENAPWNVVYLEPLPPVLTRVIDRIGPEPIFLFLTLIVMILAVFFINQTLFVRPSDIFVRHIVRLSRGRFDKRPGLVPKMWQPWFAYIEKVFRENDTLTRKIQTYNEELEDRVAQRTRELVRLNRTLNQEILERERAQDEEKKTGVILDQAISESPSGIIIADTDLSIQRANKAAFDIRGDTGPEPGETGIHTHFKRWRVFDEAGRPCRGRSLPLYQAIRNGKTTRNRELIVRDDNGQDRWLSVNAAPIRNADGRILSGIVIFHDISSLKEREIDLHRSEQQYRRLKDLYKQLSDASFEAIFLSKDGICIGQNKMAEKMFGYSLEEAFGRPGIEWIESGSREMVAAKIAAGFEGQYEAMALRKDGTSFPCEIQARMSVSPKTGIRITALRDIADRKRAEKEKLDALAFAATQAKHALVGQVAGKMAHDFNNILGVIMGNTELALTECRDRELENTLALILGQTIRGKNLTRNLVAFARDQEPRQARFSINKKIDLVVDLLRKDLAGIRVVKIYQDELPDLIADPGMIEHMLVNMLQNAVHALGKTRKPEIFIRTFGKKNMLAFEIRDNGCGIPADHLDRIFEPSFTLKGSRDVRGDYLPGVRGTGYGMANVRKYLEQHKGEVHVQSTPGRGTRFIIELPVIDRELSPEEKQEISDQGVLPGRNILLVEDEAAISDIQYNVLTQPPCRHRVDVADNGSRAVDLFSSKPYDLVSLDYVLPGELNGIDVYQKIRAADRQVPVLFVSGNIEFLESIKTLKAEDPFIDHLSKPCLNKEYIRAVHGLLKNNPPDSEKRGN